MMDGAFRLHPRPGTIALDHSMNFATLWPAALALLAGAFIPVQTGFNTQLARALQSPVVSSCVMFGVSTLALAAVAGLSGAKAPTFSMASSAPWPSWFAGGVLAAIYVVILAVVAPKLGAGTAVAFVVLGQIIMSAVIDHFGLLDFATHPLNAPRLVGIALMVAGVALVKMN